MSDNPGRSHSGYYRFVDGWGNQGYVSAKTGTEALERLSKAKYMSAPCSIKISKGEWFMCWVEMGADKRSVILRESLITEHDLKIIE